MPIIKIQIFTDGASFNNGYKNPDKPQHATGANIITLNEKVIKKIGYDYGDNTISYAELTSVLRALKYAKRKIKLMKESYGNKYDFHVEIISDSAYVVRSFNEYSLKWVKNGYRNSSGDDVSYKDIWKEIIPYKNNSLFNLTMTHTRGHQKDSSFLTEMNNLADEVATSYMKTWKEENNIR